MADPNAAAAPAAVRSDPRAAELVAVHSFAELVDVRPAELQEALQAGIAADVDHIEQLLLANKGSSVSGKVRLHADGDDDGGGGGGGDAAAAMLHFTMRPGRAPLELQLVCEVRLSKKEVQGLQLELEQQVALGDEGALVAAACAAEEGMRRALAVRRQQRAQSLQQQQQQQQQADRQKRPSPRRVLLRVDHMRDRRRYARALERIAALSGVAITLLTASPASAGRRELILALVSGDDHDAVAACLTQWRTTTVDVDSGGRPCRERMLTVLADEAGGGVAGAVVDGQQQQQQQQQQPTAGGVEDVRAESLAAAAAHIRAWRLSSVALGDERWLAELVLRGNGGGGGGGS